MDRRFLDEAIRIGDQLLVQAEHDPHGLFWETMTASDGGKAKWRVGEDMYAGNSGIALFLIELYKQTGNKSYLQAAEDAMAWAAWYVSSKPGDNYSLISGHMGVAYTLLQLYETTRDDKYLRQALAIAKLCMSFLGSYKEYLGGTAGTLLGLLHLHAATREAWILEYIDEFTRSLIASARIGEVGIYWDEHPQQVRPLCGFSHGVSGIGFVFLELGHYFGNPTFYMIAEQAFAYEDAYFNSNTSNWPDFRISMWTEAQTTEFEKFYKDGNNRPFTEPSDVNTWCHGAAGIGLARILAARWIGKERYRNDINNALTKTKRTIGQSHTFSLCHGEGGNADLFIENYIQVHDPKDIQYAEQIGEAALRQKKQTSRYRSGMEIGVVDGREDPSLFNGTAGVGYFFLRLHSKGTVPSVLAFDLSPRAATVRADLPFLSLTPSQCRRHFAKNTFPRSIQLAETYLPHLTDVFFGQTILEDSLGGSLIHFIETTVMPILESNRDRNVCSFELSKAKLLEKRSSSGLLFIAERIRLKQVETILNLPQDILMNSQLKLANECRLFAIDQGELFLTRLTDTGVEDHAISQFCYILLHAFGDQKQVKSVILQVTQLYHAQTQRERRTVQEKVLQQIREAITGGMLVPAN